MFRAMRTTIIQLLLLACLVPVAACDEDQDPPEILGIRVEDGDSVVTEIEPQSGTDTTIAEDVPPSSVLVVEFSEPIDLAGADDYIILEDAEGNAVEIDIAARRGDVTITPIDGLAPNQNHTLILYAGIEDTSGGDTLHTLRVNFYTAE
jgi:hypothetical protein